MIEVVAAVARWAQLSANLILLGSCVFLVIAGGDRRAFIGLWVDRLERLFPWLALCVIAGLLVILATTAAQVTGDVANLWRPDIWFGIARDTRMGHVWIGRAVSSVILLGTVFYLRNTPRSGGHYIFCAVIAALPLIAGSFASHTAAEGLSVAAVMPYALHIIFVGIWFGALPAFLLLLYVYVRHERGKKAKSSDIRILKRFSFVALPVMLLIVVTGIILADYMFEDDYATLVATLYGWLFNAKLALLGVILIIAAQVRSHWLPLFTKSEGVVAANNGATGMRRWVRIEFILALILLLLATIIANTTPAKHALIDEWPYPFRFSIAATWGNPNVAIQVWIGLAIVVMAAGAIMLGRALKWNMKRLIGIPLLLVIFGLAVALSPLAIEAYPETYRKSPIPFDAISVANGITLYADNCVDCHGPQGRGNGILARTFSTVLPDLLTEPHTLKHTPGDFFHWISYGIRDTEMPGYADKLSEEDRWDLINFIYALSRGYQARVLTPKVVPDKRYMEPPAFSYAAEDGTGGVLQDFRGQKAVLLTVFSWPQSQARLEQLKQAYDRLNKQGLAILAIPKEALNVEEAALVASRLPFPVVTQGASEIANSYALFRRTMGHPDLLGKRTIPDHMEFLIDRNGYLRARWIPSTGKTGWAKIDVLAQQISQLDQEKSILPPPGEYIR